MTNGAILTFKNNKILKNQLVKKIKKINLFGYQLFETKIIKKNQIFCRIKIRSKINNFNRNSKQSIFYEKKQKMLKNKIDIDFEKFNDNITFIKTTSQHIPEGQLFFRLINIKIYKIELKIFKFIK